MPTLKVSNKQFMAGNALPGGHSTPVPGGITAHESAPTLATPNPVNLPGGYLTYVFMFWNIVGANNSGIFGEADIDIQVGSDDVSASAWYFEAGTGGNPWTGVFTYTFSESQDMFLPGVIPIASVNPAAAWTGTNKVETATSAVDINALLSINYEHFDLWETYFGGTPLGDTLHANQGAAIWAAIAYYKLPGPPDFEGRILERLRDWHEIRERILLYADPGPDDLTRLKKLLDRARERKEISVEDELNRVVSKLDKMNESQMRESLAEINAQLTRLSKAQKMVETELKKSIK